MTLSPRCTAVWVLVLLAFSLSSCEKDSARDAADLITPGVTDTTILVGSSLPLSGHASYLGLQTLYGAMSYINHVNATGGVHGRTIEVKALDDQYDPANCVTNTQKLIVEDNVFALFCYVGTPTTLKIVPLIDEAKVPLVGIFTGANALREPFNRQIINVRASYYQETKAAVQHLVDDLGIKRIAVFYQYDTYGFDGLKGTELALKDYGLAPVARGTYARGTMDVEEGLNRILEANPEAVVMIGTYGPCARFIKLAEERGANPVFYAVSFVGADEIARILGPGNTSEVIMSQVVPPPDLPETRTLLWGVVEYSDMLKKYYPKELPNTVGLEAYINAKVLVEGLRRAGRDLTRNHFIDAIESIRDYSVGIANTISFSPEKHQGLERVYFNKLEDGKFALITDWTKIRIHRPEVEAVMPEATEGAPRGENEAVPARQP